MHGYNVVAWANYAINGCLWNDHFPLICEADIKQAVY